MKNFCHGDSFERKSSIEWEGKRMGTQQSVMLKTLAITSKSGIDSFLVNGSCALKDPRQKKRPQCRHRKKTQCLCKRKHETEKDLICDGFRCWSMRLTKFAMICECFVGEIKLPENALKHTAAATAATAAAQNKSINQKLPVSEYYSNRFLMYPKEVSSHLESCIVIQENNLFALGSHSF